MRRWLRRVIRLLVALVALFVGGVVVFAVIGFSAEYPFADRGSAVPKGAVAGAYHVHSTLSDGRGTPEHIALSAARQNLQFVVLTDHNPKAIDPPSFVAGVLMIPAAELSTPFGHLVALGLDHLPSAEELHSDPIAAVRRAGGSAYLAHPVQQRVPWTDWTGAANANGLELYSADTMFREAQRTPLRLLPAVGAYVTNTAHALLTLVAAQPETTERLLSLSSAAPKVALCGHDAHGLPPYDDVFSAMETWIPRQAPLPVDAKQAAHEILAAIDRGESYCVFRALGDGAGFSIQGLAPDRSAKTGGSLKVSLPPWSPAGTRLQITGSAHVLEDGRTVVLDHPGPVLIEIWRRAPGALLGSEWKPWLVPSPVLAR